MSCTARRCHSAYAVGPDHCFLLSFFFFVFYVVFLSGPLGTCRQLSCVAPPFSQPVEPNPRNWPLLPRDGGNNDSVSVSVRNGVNQSRDGSWLAATQLCLPLPSPRRKGCLALLHGTTQPRSPSALTGRVLSTKLQHTPSAIHHVQSSIAMSLFSDAVSYCSSSTVL